MTALQAQENPFEFAKAKRLAPTRVQITPQQRRAWLETKTLLLWSAPAFASVFFSMMAPKGEDEVYWTKDIPIAATDDSTMFLNPDEFCKMNLQERVFVACHEIMHAILNHCGQLHLYSQRTSIKYNDGSTLPVDRKLMGQAMDFIINDALIEGGIGKFPEIGLHDKKIATANDSMPTAYKRLYEDQQCKGGGGQGGKAGGGGGATSKGKGQGFDEHLEPGKGEGKDPTQAQNERNEAEWRMAVAAGVNSARVQGKLPAGLQRFFDALLAPKVDWTEHLQALFARKIGNSRSSWDMLDQQLVIRGIGAPGRMGHGAGTIVVGCDTSGSISQDMLTAFMSEVGGIIDDVRPKRLVVMQCDAKVQEVFEADSTDDLLNARIAGGGGTDFRPVFAKIADEFGEIDGLVYLTDGYGSFPNDAPGYPVIWGNISPAGSVRYPFGDVVDVDLTQSP